MKNTKKTILKALAGGIAASIAAMCAPVLAQDIQVSEGVAATVDKEMISTFDVAQRMRLMILTSGGRIPESAYPQLQRKALQDLVDEKLKLQEADRFEFTIDNAEIEQEVASIAASIGANTRVLEQELLRQGISPTTLRAQIKARLVWQQLVTARYRSRVRVSDDEVQEIMDRLKDQSQQEQYLLSEICIPVENQASEREIYAAGIQMIQQMQRGVPFDALAKQFSSCTSSAAGGDLGWQSLGEIEPKLAEVVSSLAPGNVSAPVQHDGMMYIMALRQKRAAAVAGERRYQVAYAGAPLSVGEEKAKEAFSKLYLANVCSGDELSVDLGKDIGVVFLKDMIPTSKMQPAFQETIRSAERGKTTDLIRTQNGYHALHVCEIDEGLGLPPRQAIEERLFSQQLQLIARRYLRDIRRDTAVEMKAYTPLTSTNTQG